MKRTTDLATRGGLFPRGLLRAGAVASLLVSFTGLLFVGSPVQAHSGDQSYLYLDVTEDSLGGRVELPFRDLRAFLDLELDGSAEEILVELDQNVDQLGRYADDHLTLGADGQEWTLDFSGVEVLEGESTDPDFGYVLLPFVAEVDGDIPRQLEVTFDPFFDELPDERDALLLIGNDWAGGVIDNTEESLVRFAPDSRSQTIDLGSTSWVSNVGASFALGLDHIRTGPDHILFVMVLLLPSVLVYTNRSWKPASSFGSALWRVLKVVTMFTVAHTITFTLAGLDILPLPGPRLVETVIALSIAAAALHNLRPIAVNREWIIAFVFGLFHGLGFASLVSGLEVSRSTQLISLLGRNLGIEVGQALVVLLSFPALYLLRRTVWYRPFFVITSVGLVIISFGWMTERLFDAPDITSTIVNAVMAFPRVLAVLAVFTAIAAGAYRLQRKNGLLPVADR